MKKEYTVHSTKLSHWTSKTNWNGNETLFSKASCWGCMSCKINCQNMSKSVLADWNPPPKGLRRSSVLPPHRWRHRMLSLLTGTNQGVEANPKFWGQTARFLFKKYPSPTSFSTSRLQLKNHPMVEETLSTGSVKTKTKFQTSEQVGPYHKVWDDCFP